MKPRTTAVIVVGLVFAIMVLRPARPETASPTLQQLAAMLAALTARGTTLEGEVSAPQQPTITSFALHTNFTAIPDSQWHAMPGVTLPVTLNAASPVQISWGFSTHIGGSPFITRVLVNGEPVAGSERLIVGAIGAGSSSSAVNTLPLAAGSYTVTVEYRTGATLSFDPTIFDYDVASLEALAFDQ